MWIIWIIIFVCVVIGKILQERQVTDPPLIDPPNSAVFSLAADYIAALPEFAELTAGDLIAALPNIADLTAEEILVTLAL